jgi:hypothetical protein
VTIRFAGVGTMGQLGFLSADTARQKTLCHTQTDPEPVFGIIKSVMGFRQFLLRGLDDVRGEWSFVTTAWNIKHQADVCAQPRLNAPPACSAEAARNPTKAM